MSYNFQLLNAAFKKESEDCRNSRTSREQEMYILHCLGNRLDVDEIDFTKFSYDSIEAASNMFSDSVRREDEDGNISFMRNSPWATFHIMTEIMWNFSRMDTKKVQPPFPLI